MAFVTDGSSHKNGISMELALSNFLNYKYGNNEDILDINKDGQLSDIRCLHEGGTQKKADAVLCANNGKQIIEYTISIKRKEFKNNKPNGTFDVINTTAKKFNDTYNVFDNKTLNNLLNWFEEQRPRIKSKDDINDDFREEVEDLISNLIDTANESADSFVDLIKKEFFKTDILVVGRIDKNNNDDLVSFFIEKENHFKLFNSQGENNIKFFFKKGNGKSSRRLWIRKSNGDEEVTPYRMRVVLNNGLSAYYGFSTANNTSVLTVKVQIDDVDFFIKQMKEYQL